MATTSTMGAINGESVTGRYFGTGNGSRLVFNLAGLDSDRALLHPVLYKQDWSGITALYSTARTNKLLQSQTLGTSWSGGTETTVSADATVAPDGSLTADKVLETAANSAHTLYQGVTATAVPHTFSIYLKAGERAFVSVRLDTGVPKHVVVNLALGTIVSTDVVYTSSSITPVGNGWYRVSVTITTTAATWYSALNISTDGVTFSYAGDITKGIYAWGGQLEVGTVDTRYIVTTTAAAATTDYSTAATGVVTLASASAAGVPLMYKEPHLPSSNVYCTFGVGDGTSTQFSLPWAPAVPAIYVNGVLKTLTTDYSYTPDGAVTFVAAPAAAAVLTWTGNFGAQR